MTTFTRPIPHRCPQNPDWDRFPVRYSDCGVRIEGLPNVTEGCPFCWTSYLTLRRERFERYARRAFVARPEEVAPVAVEMVRRLERPGFPENGTCSHFGVHASMRGLGINVSFASDVGERLKVVMTQSLFRRPAALHRARAEAVATALTTVVRHTWNGRDGSEGIVVVLNRKAPDSIVLAIRNYRALGSRIFNKSPADEAGFAAFREWYDAPL